MLAFYHSIENTAKMRPTIKAMTMTEEISIYMKAVLLRLKSQAREKGPIRVKNLPALYFRLLYKGHQVLVLFVFFLSFY